MTPNNKVAWLVVLSALAGAAALVLPGVDARAVAVFSGVCAVGALAYVVTS